MAPQTHGLITLMIVGIFVLASALGLTKQVSLLEYVSILIWGVGIDIDHFLNANGKAYFKDVLRRSKKGGGKISGDIKSLICIFHIWPGLVMVWMWGFGMRYFFRDFRPWIPFVFWAIHVIIDRFQNTPEFTFGHINFFYPFLKKEKRVEKGYPMKPPWEFILDATLAILALFVLVGAALF